MAIPGATDLPVLKISRSTVGKLPAVEKPTVFYDADLKGFGLKVQPSGARSWIVEYRPGISGRGTAKRRIVLGQPPLVSPEKARQLAKDILAEARVGADPASRRADDRAAISVTAMVDAFMEQHVEARRKAGTADDYRAILDRLVKPTLGTAIAAKLTLAEIAKLHLSLKSTPYQANRMLAILGSAYAFAGRRGLVPKGTNPAREIEKYRETARERYLTADELARLGDAIRETESIGIERKLRTH